jgi:hypothetical protein
MTVVLDQFDGQDHSRDVVVYKAVVRFAVEQGTLWLNPRFSETERLQILGRPLRLPFKGVWPPTLTGDAGHDLQLLAYTRLVVGMNVRNRTMPDATPAEIRESVYSKRPALDPARHIADIEQYAQCKFSVASGEEHGEHSITLGFSAGRLPGSEDPGSLNNDLQKLVEADLREKALALAPDCFS